MMQDEERTFHRASVAVIGAGVAGLVTARELMREGHCVVVYEQTDGLGGVWRYSPETDSELLGLDRTRQRTHSSTYESLRTNLPREVMSFSDFPFIPEAMEGRSHDARRFPHHTEVLEWLNVFADKFDVRRLIQFQRRIVRLEPLQADLEDGPSSQLSTASWKDRGLPRWRVTSTSTSPDACLEEESSQVYDAVVSCSGNYFEPNLPQVEGLADCPLHQIHSHSYRSSKPYRDRTVLVVGAAFSGEEVARQLADVARKVYHSARVFPGGEYFEPRPNLERVPMLSQLRTNGEAVLADGRCLSDVDSVVYCTGYNYAYPFLEGSGIVQAERMRVTPLWRHIFVPQYAPTLAFVGLIQKSIRNSQFELQAKVVARALSGRIVLPDVATMEADVACFHQRLEEAGVKVEHTHIQSAGMPEDQWQYNQGLSQLAGVPPVPTFIRDLSDVVLAAGTHSMFIRPDTFREDWLSYEKEVFEAGRLACLRMLLDKNGHL